MKNFLLIAIGLIVISCASQKNAETTQVEPDIPLSDITSFEVASQKESLFASIKRGYCFGRCPVYEMRIYSSGKVILEGTANIDFKGWNRTKISKEEMQNFIAVAEDIKFFEMKDEYDNPQVTDIPETTTTLVQNGVKKSVRRRIGFPAEIKAFEKLFDDLLENAEWETPIKDVEER